jgi:hypothetical protein
LEVKEFDESAYFDELKTLIKDYKVKKEDILSKSH